MEGFPSDAERMPGPFRLSDRITLFPVIHGSGDLAVEVRRVLLAGRFDAIAVPLPPSFQQPVEEAVERLPTISAVVQRESQNWIPPEWTPDDSGEEACAEADEPAASYVPIDPCQPVIQAVRFALSERIPRAFLDLETARFVVHGAVLPDPFAVKTLPWERFASGVMPLLPPLPPGQPRHRVAHMAARLRELERTHKSILALCSILDWSGLRLCYRERPSGVPAGDDVEPAEAFPVDPRTLLFMLGELPFITALYERARRELDDDSRLSIDGVKELLTVARRRAAESGRVRAQEISPARLAVYFRYVRNLCLIERRLTPDLYSLVVAAQQIFGDGLALAVAETAREYNVSTSGPTDAAGVVAFGRDRLRLPDGEILVARSRLPGPPIVWRTCRLKRPPERRERLRWQLRWNPFSQCSWPPEDVVVERFRTHVTQKALALLGNDLAHTEKFTTSLLDGLDVRETLRNWHTGDLYVKRIPPSRGKLDCVLLFFDAPSDPRDYPWRTTWNAEFDWESDLAFYASDYRKDLVGPGIARAQYGGVMFLFPARHLQDIWSDPRFDAADTLEERLLLAACRYAEERHIAVASAAPPGPVWRGIARRHKKKLIHVPLGGFGQETIARLRTVHVLNGKQVRSYAADYIRRL